MPRFIKAGPAVGKCQGTFKQLAVAAHAAVTRSFVVLSGLCFGPWRVLLRHYDDR